MQFKALRSRWLLGLPLLACSGGVSFAQADPGFKNIIMSTVRDSGQTVTVFRADAPRIYIRAEVSGVPLDSKLTCLWIAAQAAGVAPDHEIAKVDLLASRGLEALNCDLSKPTNGFPVGAYRVDLLVNGKKTNEMRFEVAEGAPVSASRSRQTFTVVNSTGYDISEVYVSPAKGKDWEDDVLGDDELEDGDEKLIRFNRPEKTCFWDLKVVYSEDDSEAIWYDLDLCKISKVTIKYDRKRDKTTAFFD
jgi:hypothetical protein